MCVVLYMGVMGGGWWVDRVCRVKNFSSKYCDVGWLCNCSRISQLSITNIYKFYG